MDPTARQTLPPPNPSPATPAPAVAPSSKSIPVKPSPTFPQLSVGRHSAEPRPGQTSPTPNPTSTRPSLATTSRASISVKPGQASAVPPLPNQPNTRKSTRGLAWQHDASFPTKLTATRETAPHPAPPGQGQSNLVQPKCPPIPPQMDLSAPSVAPFVALVVARTLGGPIPQQPVGPKPVVAPPACHVPMRKFRRAQRRPVKPSQAQSNLHTDSPHENASPSNRPPFGPCFSAVSPLFHPFGSPQHVTHQHFVAILTYHVRALCSGLTESGHAAEAVHEIKPPPKRQAVTSP
jgi:hypothetical protein